MKKSKRLISLILAVVMVLSFMAMSASAATTEVQPRASICPDCGGNGYVYWKTEYPKNLNLGAYEQISRGTCTAGPSTHVHYKSVPATVYSRCSSCGNYDSFSTYRNYCPYGGIS